MGVTAVFNRTVVSGAEVKVMAGEALVGGEAFAE